MNETIDNNQINIGINVDRLTLAVLILCVGFEISFVLLDIFINYNELTDSKTIHRFFNIAREDSLASWFGTMQTFMVGLTLWLIFFVQKHGRASKKAIFGWCMLALFFTYMAVDDGAEIHERLGTIFEAISEAKTAPGESPSWISGLITFFPSYPWQILFIPFFGTAGIFILIFLWYQLRPGTAKVLVILALTCFVIAVGLDFIEGLDKKHPWNFHTRIRHTYHLDKYTVRHFSKSAEEFLEMFGITLFWSAFIQYFKLLPEKGVRFFAAGKNKAR
ncbi:hypothetical protein DENIS_1089 [Desulfonema ishimotonii]|uniref:Uncharacterized protein n=1 Tax=Desulfonema ishimotonii TaxID=45657 RepID=A0A401FT66_9BACT|nr:hypothetical protein [Desulfonema ishimotonii]GBC60144.1 hypothetical protein DENIS_1089 [Desulfonema ishimotonii]